MNHIHNSTLPHQDSCTVYSGIAWKMESIEDILLRPHLRTTKRTTPQKMRRPVLNTSTGVIPPSRAITILVMVGGDVQVVSGRRTGQ